MTCVLFAGCSNQQEQEQDEKYILHLEEGWQDCYNQLQEWQKIATELDSILQSIIKEED